METPAFGGTRGVTFAPHGGAASVDSTPTQVGAGAATTADDRLRDVLLYANPPVTYLVIILGTIVLGLGHFILSGVHNVTLLTGGPGAAGARAALPCCRCWVLALQSPLRLLPPYCPDVLTCCCLNHGPQYL